MLNQTRNFVAIALVALSVSPELATAGGNCSAEKKQASTEGATAQFASSAGAAAKETPLAIFPLAEAAGFKTLTAAVKAAGLVLVSYPLHPPKKPETLRTAHLEAVAVPTLFVSGDLDACGTPQEVRRAHALGSGPVSVEWVEGGRHELKRKADNADVAGRIATWLTC